MVQLASYLRRALCKTRLIFPRINGPNVVTPETFLERLCDPGLSVHFESLGHFKIS